MEHGDMTQLLWIIRFVCPRIGSCGLGMIFQGEHFHDTFPYGLTLKRLFDPHTLNVRGFDAVQVLDYVL
jgi:hypothetical protein